MPRWVRDSAAVEKMRVLRCSVMLPREIGEERKQPERRRRKKLPSALPGLVREMPGKIGEEREHTRSKSSVEKRGRPPGEEREMS